MPVQQISVVPARETASNGRTSSRSKEKSKEAESEKPPRRSGSRSSNISKASSSTTGLGHTSVSRTSVTPSSQDICSPGGALAKVEEESVEHTPVTVLSRPAQPPGKRQVKRRHRKRRDGPQGPGENSSDSREECARNPRRDGSSSASSSDEGEEGRREARSWIRERTRRVRRRGPSGRVREEAWGETRDVELVSVDSDDGPETNGENPTPPSEGQGGAGARSGLKNRRKPSANQEEHRASPASSSQKGKSGNLEEILSSGRSHGSSSPHKEDIIAKIYEECGPSPASSSQKGKSRSLAEILSSGRSHGSSSPLEDDHMAQIYEERGSGEDTLCAPCPTAALIPVHPACPSPMAHCSDDELEVCRICHCEGDEDCPLITPCRCTGSLRFVHQGCLHQWIKSSDTRCCELCKYDFIMQTQLKPLRKWEKLQMSASERRKIICSVTFHIIAVTCVVWSLYVLIDRTAEEIKQGKENGVLEWPFWTKLIVVAIGFTGGLIFMYIQCKVYLQLWRRLKAFNRIIFVQNCPDTLKKGDEKAVPLTQSNGTHDSVDMPASQLDTNCHRPAGGAVVPDVAPV